MVLDHRRPPLALRLGERRSALLPVVVLGMIGVLALVYAGLVSRAHFVEVLLLGAAALGLFIPPQRLIVAIIPAWMLAPTSGDLLTVARAATFVLFVGLALRFVGGTVRVRREVNWLAAFAIVLILSLFHPVIPGSMMISPEHDLSWVLTGLAVAATAICVRPAMSVVARTTAIAGALVAVIALVGGVSDEGRLVGADQNPNSLGLTLAIPCIAAFGLAWDARKPLWLVAAAPSAVAMVQAHSRGALVAIVAGIGYLALRNRSWRQRAVVVAGSALLAVLFGSHLTALLIGGRSSTELDVNNAVRAEALRLAVQVAAEHPLRGIGYARFPAYAADAPQVGIFINTHNEYARLACEAGVPAAALFVAILVLAMRGSRDRDDAVLGGIVVVYTTGLLFGNFISSMPISVPFWVALGCLLARREEPPPLGPGHVPMHGQQSPRQRAATVPQKGR